MIEKVFVFFIAVVLACCLFVACDASQLPVDNNFVWLGACIMAGAFIVSMKGGRK